MGLQGASFSDFLSHVSQQFYLFLVYTWSERMVNLPPQLGTAMLETLFEETSELSGNEKPARVVMMFKGYQYTKKVSLH